MNTDTANKTNPPVTDQELIRRLTGENRYLKERIDLLLAQIYGKKSEKRPLELEGQLSYLEDPLQNRMRFLLPQTYPFRHTSGKRKDESRFRKSCPESM